MCQAEDVLLKKDSYDLRIQRPFILAGGEFVSK